MSPNSKIVTTIMVFITVNMFFTCIEVFNEKCSKANIATRAVSIGVKTDFSNGI